MTPRQPPWSPEESAELMRVLRAATLPITYAEIGRRMIPPRTRIEIPHMITRRRRIVEVQRIIEDSSSLTLAEIGRRMIPPVTAGRAMQICRAAGIQRTKSNQSITKRAAEIRAILAADASLTRAEVGERMVPPVTVHRVAQICRAAGIRGTQSGQPMAVRVAQIRAILAADDSITFAEVGRRMDPPVTQARVSQICRTAGIRQMLTT